MSVALNFLMGLIFGAGLIVSGMANPEKVLNFLDLTGTWDPSLILVMAGAIAVTAPGYALARRRRSPLLEPAFDASPPSVIDTRLLIGAVIFGVGWGLSGLCPGPALTALPLAAPGTLVFVPALVAGIWAGAILIGRMNRREDG
jgi:uncharacterized membrane protein YedE/YeeE